jgi:hypothetical protein
MLKGTLLSDLHSFMEKSIKNENLKYFIYFFILQRVQIVF